MPYHFVKREKKDMKCDDPLTSEGNTTYYNTFTDITFLM